MKILCTADWHITNQTPICRDDDFMLTQEKVIEEIFRVAEINKAKVFIAGDIFDKARPNKAQELEVMLLRHFNLHKPFFIAGNHDLLFHRVENWNKGSIGVLFQAIMSDNLLDENSFGFYHYGQEIKNEKIVMFHKYISENSIPDFINNGMEAGFLCETHPETEIFIVGDNHHGFFYKHKTGQIVINPGCITRQEISFKDYKSRVYILDTETKEVTIHYLSDNDPEIMLDFTNKDKRDRLERIDSFIEKLRDNNNFSLDFEKNISSFCKEQKIDSKVIEKINQAMGV